MEKLADESKAHNMTIWFGHHPFSALTTPSIRKILRYVRKSVRQSFIQSVNQSINNPSVDNFID